MFRNRVDLGLYLNNILLILRSIMKNKSIIIILLILATQLNLFAQSYSIKLVFEPGFSAPFQVGQYWEDVNEQAVKTKIVNIVTGAYNSGYGIPVSIVAYPYSGGVGDVIAYIGSGGGVALMAMLQAD